MPTEVRMTETAIPNERPWAAKVSASCRSPFPSAVPIRAVVPAPRPLPTAMIRKKTGNDNDRAASAWVEIRPPYQVSTALNIVLKKKPTLAGTAILRIRAGMGVAVSVWIIRLLHNMGYVT